jgi:glycosyltransferase involved in cell wall biosynthesis
MKVLMFGWEFPPHISGGLGTACYGLTTSLKKEKTDILFVVPKTFGDEPDKAVELVSASEIDVPLRRDQKLIVQSARIREIINVRHEEGITTFEVPSTLSPYGMTQAAEQARGIEHWSYPVYEPGTTLELEQTEVTVPGAEERTRYAFKGGYGDQLLQEVARYGEVAGIIGQRRDFDVIHVHDWMTIPAGLAAQAASHKPLVVHIHATEFDRAGGTGHPGVHALEKEGMEKADHVVAVSQWTKDIIIAKYGIPARKISVVHNGIIAETHDRNGVWHPMQGQVITFLGRITHQKGPLYFVEAARKVHQHFPDAHFVMAGSGDMLPAVIERVASLRMSSHFHYTGFLKKQEINKVLALTDIYVMPSVSEPFGITPLEAIQAGVPVIISKQSGVAEVLDSAIKVDFWDVDALANAMATILKYKSLSSTLKKNSQAEVQTITWDKTAHRVNEIYAQVCYSQVAVV